MYSEILQNHRQILKCMQLRHRGTDRSKAIRSVDKFRTACNGCIIICLDIPYINAAVKAVALYNQSDVVAFIFSVFSKAGEIFKI